MGASVWILTFDGAGDVKDPPAGGVRQPGQPAEGPGGASYRHGGVRKEVYGEGPEQFWIFEPRDPAPRTAPVIVFGHGGGGVNPRFYGAWIEHLVRRGNIVIYPRYQHNVLPRPGKVTEAFVGAVKAAFDELKKSERVRPEVENVALVGHSWGGVLSANLAAMTGSAGLPRPRALMIIAPGIGGVPLQDLSKVPKDARARRRRRGRYASRRQGCEAALRWSDAYRSR
jgi:acetyl esterase/lipase